MKSIVELHTAIVSHFANFASDRNIPFQYGERLDNKGIQKWFELLVEGPVISSEERYYFACRLICATRERDVYAPQRLLDIGKEALTSISTSVGGCLFLDSSQDIIVEDFKSVNKAEQLKEPSLVFFYCYEGE